MVDKEVQIKVVVIMEGEGGSSTSNMKDMGA
jgi:hypothetical protein